MHLAIDIGNSALKGGVFQGERLRDTFRFSHDAWKGSDPSALLARHLKSLPIERAAVSSVVPSHTQVVANALVHIAGAEPLIVRPGLILPIALAYSSPSQLGSDRIAAAVAGWSRFSIGPNGIARPVLVVDAGTAVTFNVIDAHGIFRGGMIWAGPDLVRGALATGTAQLPAEGGLTRNSIPTQTEDAVTSGVLFGFLDGVKGMIQRTTEALGEQPYVIATGGRGNLLAENLEVVVENDPDLVLRGLELILRAN